MTEGELNSGGQDESAEGRSTVTVPSYNLDDDAVEWMEVDKEWYEHTEKAKEVNRKVGKIVGDEPGVVGTEISRGEQTNAGWHKTYIAVLVDDDETTDSLSIPDVIDGIPISVENEDTSRE